MTEPKFRHPTPSEKDIASVVREEHEDRRCLRGKYAPPVGKCRVCGGRVVGEVTFPDDGCIGGPPRRGYVGRWSCEDCCVVYAKCPTEKPMTAAKQPELPARRASALAQERIFEIKRLGLRGLREGELFALLAMAEREIALTARLCCRRCGVPRAAFACSSCGDTNP